MMAERLDTVSSKGRDITSLASLESVKSGCRAKSSICAG